MSLPSKEEGPTAVLKTDTQTAPITADPLGGGISRSFKLILGGQVLLETPPAPSDSDA